MDMKPLRVQHTSREDTRMRPQEAHLPQVWTTRLLVRDKCHTPHGGLTRVLTFFDVSCLCVPVVHHGLGAVYGNHGFSTNRVIHVRTQQLLTSNSFNSTQATAGLYSEWYPRSLWAPDNWCLGVTVQVWHGKGSPQSLSSIILRISVGSGIFLHICSICLNPFAPGDSESWCPIAGLGPKWFFIRVPIVRLSTEDTKSTLIRDLKEDPGAEARRPNTTHGWFETTSCTWEGGHATCSGSEAKRSIIIAGTTQGQAGEARTTP